MEMNVDVFVCMRLKALLDNPKRLKDSYEIWLQKNTLPLKVVVGF